MYVLLVRHYRKNTKKDATVVAHCCVVLFVVYVCGSNVHNNPNSQEDFKEGVPSVSGMITYAQYVFIKLNKD